MPIKLPNPRSLAACRAFARKIAKEGPPESRPRPIVRNFPTAVQVRSWFAKTNPSDISENEDGQRSALSVTALYVAEFLRLNNLKKD
ncbi:MAG: hypothetical protein PHI64_12780 [Zoogloea sp.]|uniref:hypothetical protein n=1 Tax=Zoogloea sp. TaxID=49181 RepID=UPI00261F7FFB|nr:hypothetical protein [Zoogloea sp.]MDD2989823.1 hypothetical protein [Zoogloea sp.]